MSLTVNWGPQHPSSGHFRMVTTIDGDRIVKAIPKIGYTHRGIEKLLENRDYIPAIPMIERFNMTDCAPMNMCWILGVEDLLGAEVPDRAHYLRTILCEISRIASHLYNLALYTVAIGMYTPFMWAIGDREYFLRLAEELTGVRLAFAYMLPGGVRRDMSEDLGGKIMKTVDYLEKRIPEYNRFVYESPTVEARGRNVGVLTREEALEMGAAGPVLRGSGVALDMRKKAPYAAYEKMDFDVVSYPEGDSHARMLVRFGEMVQSFRILRQAVKEIPNGDIHAVTKKTSTIVRTRGVPEGKTYVRCEAARGMIGLYLESHGGRRPYRAKFSTPSFRNAYILPKIFNNAPVADAPATYHSLDIWALEMDR